MVSYLPSRTERDNAIFTGTANVGAHGAPPSSSDELFKFSKEAEVHEEDAQTRNLVWSAEADLELGDADAEGEDDPGDLVQGPDGVYVSRSTLVPVGLRNENGDIEPVPRDESRTPTAHFQGIKEPVMTRLQEIVSPFSICEVYQFIWSRFRMPMSHLSLALSRKPKPCSTLNRTMISL